MFGFRRALLPAAIVFSVLFSSSSSTQANILYGTNADPLPQGILVTAGYIEWAASCTTQGGYCQLFPNDTTTGPSGFDISTQVSWLNANTDWGPVTTDITGSLGGGTNPTANTTNSYRIWAFHQDQYYIALLYSSAINSWSLTAPTTGQFSGISGIFAFHPSTSCPPGTGCGSDVVPLPPAILLFVSGLAGLGLIGIRRRRRTPVSF
jgi:hypothetical protein